MFECTFLSDDVKGGEFYVSVFAAMQAPIILKVKIAVLICFVISLILIFHLSTNNRFSSVCIYLRSVV